MLYKYNMLKNFKYSL